jgi:HEAT repeat protein
MIENLANLDEEKQIALLKDLCYQKIEIPTEYFDSLFRLLVSPNDSIRFWILTIIVQRMSIILYQRSDEFVPILTDLLLDTSHLVVDRVLWALDITSEKSTPYLLEMVKATTDDELKARITWAFRRSADFANYLETIIQQLTSLLEYPNYEVRRNALNALFEILEQKKTNIHFDLQSIKVIAQNPLKEFLVKEKDEYLRKRYLTVFT